MDQGLSAIRAAAARVGDYSLLAVLVYEANEHPSRVAEAGAQALEAAVVSLYGVVMLSRAASSATL